MMGKFKASNRFVVSLATLLLSATVFTGAVYAESGGLNGIGAPQAPPADQQVAQGTTQDTVQQSTTTVTQPNASQSTTTPQTGAAGGITPQVPTDGSGAAAVGSLFQGVGVDGAAAKQANQYMAPIAKGANVLFALILGLASIAMFLITALDLAYIAVPPVRNFLHPGAQAQGGGGGMGGGMGGGFGGGMGGGGFGGGGFGHHGGGYGGGGGMMGGGMGGGQQAQSGFLTRWISDEAVAAVATLQPAGGGGGGMMGGMGMGMQQQEPPRVRSVIFSYMKKRAFFLIMFGICAVLLSTTVFSDLGIKLGGWILNRLLGVQSSIPQ